MKVDHSTSKGYPWDIIISKDRFKHRLSPILDRGKNNRINIDINPKVYPEFLGIRWYHRLFAGTIIDFFMFRIFDYAEALHVAEQQVEDLLMEAPFIPEEFGFNKIVGPKEISDNPVKIYSSIFNENMSIFRNNEKECEWVLLEKIENHFKETKLQLPNHRIAYALFYALDIQVEPKTIEEKLTDTVMSVTKEYRIVYGQEKENDYKTESIIVNAISDEDARSKAKFILESDKFKFTNVDTEKLIILH